jgi:hypothetical protein
MASGCGVHEACRIAARAEETADRVEGLRVGDGLMRGAESGVSPDKVRHAGDATETDVPRSGG